MEIWIIIAIIAIGIVAYCLYRINCLNKANSSIYKEKEQEKLLRIQYKIDYDRLKKQFDENTNELKQIKASSIYYKNEYELACRENEVLKHKLNTLKSASHTLTTNAVYEPNVISENIELGKSIAEMRETIKKKDNEILRLQNNNRSLLCELEDAKKQTNRKLDVIQAKNDEIRRLNDTNNSLNFKLEQIKEDYDAATQHIKTIEKQLGQNQKFIEEQNDLYKLIKQEQASIERVKHQIVSLASLPFARLPDDFQESILTGRLANAFETTNLSIHGPLQMSATIRSDEHFYNTTLSSCSCPDFQNRHIPCKHMLFLSYTSGLLLLNSEAFTNFAQINLSRLNNKIIEEKNESALAKSQNKLLQQKKREHLKLVTRLKAELDQSYPWLARMYRRFQMEEDKHDTYLLSTRSTTSKQIIKKIKKSNADLKYEKAILENQLTVYETLFPWLEEFKNVDVDKAVEYVSETQNDKEYDKVSDYLSPAEYKTLSISKKNQLALDRYKKHRKSDWEVGIDYERYIGYRYETQGYKVKYTGAIDYVKDMGRDLICSKGSEVLVIQCKRWSVHKTIHEKHIFQLYGSVMQLKFAEPDKNYKPLFYTTTTLSDVAKFCADQLGIEIIEKEKFIDYPCIKCNISRNGEKIYHLPFDQQYDRISIESANGECYVATVEEAESKGFRRAYKHTL